MGKDHQYERKSTDSIMNVEFINPFLTALLDVMKTMAQIELQPGHVELKEDTVARGDISGLIGMVGPQVKGSFSISFDEELGLKTYSNMLGEEAKEIDEQVTDMMGEITNMVTGGAKKLLAEKGYEFEMAKPAVVTGKEHKINHTINGPKLTMPFSSEYGNAVIEISFEE